MFKNVSLFRELDSDCSELYSLFRELNSDCSEWHSLFRELNSDCSEWHSLFRETFFQNILERLKFAGAKKERFLRQFLGIFVPCSKTVFQ